MRSSFDAAGVQTHVLGRPGSWPLRASAISLVRLITNHGIDIVHINGTPDERIIGQIAAARCKILVVNTFHGVALGDLVPSSRRHAMGRTKRRLRTMISRRLIRVGDQHLVAVSRLVRDSHARALRLPPDDFVVVNPGLPDSFFEPSSELTRASVRSELGVVDDDLVIMNVARFDPGKGQDVLVEAFSRLADRPNLRLVLVGDGTARVAVQDAVREHGLDDRVSFLGSRDDVSRLLRGADMFVNASNNEGFGIAPLEAMAAGLPVVAVTGVNNAVVEFVEDGSTGLLVDDTGPVELASAVERLADDAELRARLGERARAGARDWSATASVRRLERLYLELLDSEDSIDGGAAPGSRDRESGAPAPAFTDTVACQPDLDDSLPFAAVDVEGRITIDHGAVRLGSLSKPGWGREALGFGPHQSRCGRVFSIELLNGHNGSELTVRWPSPLWYAYNHLLGSRTEHVVPRLLDRLRGKGRLSLRRQLVRLVHHRRASRQEQSRLDTNLAVGWIGAPISESPLGGGHGFTVVAREAVNADLCVDVCGTAIPIVPGLQNIGMSLAVVLRERGALLCVDEGLLGGTPGRLRPVAIDPASTPPSVWAAAHQSLSGQFAWTVDSRVRSAAVHDEAALTNWYTTAVFADQLIGNEELSARRPDRGPDWRSVGTAFERTDAGVRAGRGEGVALADPSSRTSMIHVELAAGASGGLVVRASDATTGWFLWLDKSGSVRMECRRNGVCTEEHSAPPARVSHFPSSLQILDDGRRLSVVADGVEMLTVLSEATGDGKQVGLASSHTVPLWGMRRFEAHPMSIDLELGHPPGRPLRRRGDQVLRDDFVGTGPLAGRAIGAHVWKQALCTRPGEFVLDEGTALVRVSPESSSKVVRNLIALVRPVAGRIAYTVPWKDPAAVSLSAEIVPPGTGRGAGDRGRAGLILWQDADNFVVVSTWLDDSYAGVSLSSFYRLDGFEELFDAVWTNVGTRIEWGQPYRLDLDCVEGWFELRLNDIPVLERSITDVSPAAGQFRITEVGLVSNWEFGNDTGSRFCSFSAHLLDLG